MERERLSWFNDVPAAVEAAIPARSMRLAEVLALRPGDVVSTALPAGSNIDVFAGGARIGSGELSRTGPRTAIRMARFGGKR